MAREHDLAAALDATIDRARGSALYAARLAGVRVRTLADLQAIPLTTRADLQGAGIHGTRAVPLERVCHYGESSGTTGASNSVWLTAGDLDRNAEVIRALHPEVFAPGRIILNRFPFMAAPAHLMQRIAQRGAGISIPAGNINWDVPFPRALELAERTGAHVLAGMPIEPVVLGELARARGIDAGRDLAVDTLFLGGAPLPPTLQRRLAAAWGARVIELYGSTETMLLGTSCREGTLHLEGALAHAEILTLDRDEPAPPGADGRLVVTTLDIEGSPMVRLDTGDVVRRTPSCRCGDPRTGIVVLGRVGDVIEVAGHRCHPYEVIDAAAAAADALDSAVFFVVIFPDRLLVRIETRGARGDAANAFRARLPEVPVEVEEVEPCMLLDVETLSRSPHVYKPVVMSDWRRPGRRILTVMEGMIEWPRPTWPEGRRWLERLVRTARRRRRLARSLP
ncbi:MAG: phenylacetate--CoA ligase family protein, partial [Candidatus Binatia bacterium]